jgi:1,4-dihydroxy-2-naphthoate octaprenyltransferase
MTTLAVEEPTRGLAPKVPVPGSANWFRVWIQAIRPKTLTAAVVPVLVGTGLAYAHGGARLAPALAALVGALLIQIGTNLTNDYYDFKKGADTAARLGPPRVTQQGLIPPGHVLTAALGAFALALLVGLYLTWVGGWPILVIGVASVLSGYAYTGGPFPLGYHGLGDVFVLVFFGFVAVGGTYFVQTGSVTPAVWLAGLPVGALGTALLAVNNLRDVDTDVTAGKRTLAVRFGRSFARGEYGTLLVVAFAAPALMKALGLAGTEALLSWLAAPLALGPLRGVMNEQGVALNVALHGTARLQLGFGCLFALGLALGSP